MFESLNHKEQNETRSTQESTLETVSHLDVSKLMAEKNAFFVHMIQVTDALDVSENNKGIDTKKLSIPDKLDMLYGVSPTTSVSTLRPHTKDNTFMGAFGVVLAHGEVEHAAPGDDGTVALSVTKRHVIGGVRNEKKDIDTAIDKSIDHDGYNELVIKNPDVGGGFMKISFMKDRIEYKEEEREYYNGEKIVTKVGVVNFSNPSDKYGKPTGANFDKPFSVLNELYARGKTFFLGEDNQMYLVRNIDPVSRKVEFIDKAISPRDFAFYYGKEKMNPYNKKEIRDRLERSLDSKGIIL